MKLWILEPVDNLPADDNPWNPWFDKSFGFVVRANTENEARKLAHDNAGDENRGEFLGKRKANTVTPWLDPRYSTCIELTGDGKCRVLMQDFARA